MTLPQVIRELLENGVHFGHLSKHWNPKMRRFIFGKKKRIYIIDLEKTVEKLEEAKNFLRDIASRGGKILFVSTKKQLKETMEEVAIKCNMPYVVDRWVGGLLTNFTTIKDIVRRYLDIKERKEKGLLKDMPTKELLRLNREFEKMERHYRGVVSLESLPDCLYIVDPKREISAVREARKLNIPIVALIDTDSDPESIDYPIPGNDDAIKSVRYITNCLVEAVLEGERSTHKEKEAEHKEEEIGKDVSIDPEELEQYEEIEEEIQEKELTKRREAKEKEA